ncbi:Inositol 2-dehydrogenase [Symmachiella macrocystis]|uniref:Inositol 2-dehydrogenase n=1 Tax=Symmachiella macrocystis TaxID=2527985 RepID=A0A5C6BHH0_9PLAN|nr:Gfo/Idh/MocA family oxidoreductase [Symmachiella macrocystis]TWU11410.1 Inositol 2-dehydrogenase [Symmachiella macrocystis]
MSEKSNESSTRRDFLKASSVVAAGAGVLGNLSFASQAFAAGDDTIRVGLIGAGGRGRGAASQALSTEGNIKLVAIADAFSDRLEDGLTHINGQMQKNKTPERVDIAEENKFVGFDAYQKVLDSDVDVVILATPPGFRPIHFEAAVNADKHVFMEKPVATDAPGVRKVLAAAQAAKQKNLAVGVGLQRHHQKPYLELVDRVHNGAIGDIVAMRVYWNGGGVWDPRRTREECSGEMEYQMRNWYYYTWLCGDHIVEQHIHNLDVGNWLMKANPATGEGYPVSASGMGGRQVRTDKKYGEIFDHHAVEYVYDNGTRMYSQCRHMPGCPGNVTEHAHGTKGVVHLGGRDYSIEGENNTKFKGKYRDPYQVEHDQLFAAIRSGTPYSEAERGAYSTLTAIIGRLATYSGKEIKWNQALNSEISLMPETYAWDAAPPTLPNEHGEYQIAHPGLTKVV